MDGSRPDSSARCPRLGTAVATFADLQRVTARLIVVEVDLNREGESEAAGVGHEVDEFHAYATELLIQQPVEDRIAGLLRSHKIEVVIGMLSQVNYNNLGTDRLIDQGSVVPDVWMSSVARIDDRSRVFAIGINVWPAKIWLEPDRPARSIRAGVGPHNYPTITFTGATPSGSGSVVDGRGGDRHPHLDEGVVRDETEPIGHLVI
jgi:hypothetical protein